MKLLLLGIALGGWLGLPAVQAASVPTNQPGFRLVVELQDGSRVVGRGGDAAFQFKSELLGEFQLPLERVRSLEWPPKTNAAKLTSVNGDILSAQVAMKTIRVETAFGDFAMPVELIRRLSVSAWRNLGAARPGLVAMWPGEGNAEDALGANHGTLMNRVGFVPGKVGQAFEFDGLSSYVKIPQSPALNLAEQVTIAFWMKARADNPMNACCQGLVTSDFYVTEISGQTRTGGNFAINTAAIPPIDAGAGGGRLGGRRVGLVNGEIPFLHISDANAGSGANVTVNEWHHIAGTYDGTKLQLYVDGRPWGNPTPGAGKIAPMLPDSFLAIGSEDGRASCPTCINTRYFKGAIDEVALYDRALTAAEIEAICAEQNQGELPPASRPGPPNSDLLMVPRRDLAIPVPPNPNPFLPPR